jgi:succinate-acetate transporter protein
MAQFAAETERAEPVAAVAANPAPLGLCAFALTTFVLSAANAGFFGVPGVFIVMGPAYFYGGLAQLLAGMWEFRSGNTFGGTAFSSYGGFWLAVGVILQFHPNVIAGGAPIAAGFFLLGWTIFTGLMFLGTLRTNLALMAVFFFLFLTFLALAIGAFASSVALNTIGGWLGIITALIAWYTALAGILASGKSAFTLPVWPRE